MRAVVWHGKRDVRVDEVPDPVIQDPGDAIIRVTSTNICGSDLHLYEVLGAFMSEGDVLGHEAMGVVEEVGAGVTAISPGDRVVIPFQVCCGTAGCASTACRASARRPRCATRARGRHCSATRSSTAPSPAARPSTCACRRRSTRTSRCPTTGPTTGSSTSPTCCRPRGRRSRTPTPTDGTLARARARPDRRHGLPHRAAPRACTVIGVDRVAARLDRARRCVLRRRRPRDVDDVGDAVRELTAGRGADAVIDAVGMEAHGSPVVEATHKVASRSCPTPWASG